MTFGLPTYCGYFQVCVCLKNGPCGLNFQAVFASNRSEIGQYIGFRLISWQLSAVFTQNFIYKLIGDIFVGV